MYSYQLLLQQANEAISHIAIPEQPEGLYAPIRYALGLGGKRLRPVLCLMACNLFSDSIEAAMEAALGLEVFHNFTLLHDDIMDHADLRRGQPTVHKKWNENTAILSGDTMQNIAIQQILKTPKYTLEVLNIFTQMMGDVFEGQQYDIDFEQQERVSIDQYLNMIYLKTAALIASSLSIGALIGGANEKQLHYIHEFGKNMGLAFQLRDDLLDVYGDPKTFGKATGGDILCNKKTYLLLCAFDRSTPQQKTLLLQTLEDTNQSNEQKIARVTHLYNEIGVREICEHDIENFTTQALLALKNVEGVEDVRKEELQRIAKKMLVRNN